METTHRDIILETQKLKKIRAFALQRSSLTWSWLEKKRFNSKHIMNNSKLINCILLIECMKINSEFLKSASQGLLIFLFHCIGDEKVRNERRVFRCFVVLLICALMHVQATKQLVFSFLIYSRNVNIFSCGLTEFTSTNKANSPRSIY